jgi:hypothetical protein
MIHCGGNHVTESVVKKTRTPEPVGQHYPISHMHLIDTCRNILEQTGFPIVRTEHALNDHKGVANANYFGLMEIQNPEDDDYGLVIGLRNSHTKQFRASFAAGARVFVCDNLSFSGEVVIARKHTRHIMRDLESCVAQAMGNLNERKIEQDTRFAAYKETTLNRAETDHAVINLLRARAIPSSKVLPVVQYLEEPKHQEHLGPNGETTVWTLFNAITEDATKGSNVFQLPKKTACLHAVCDNLSGLALLSAA